MFSPLWDRSQLGWVWPSGGKELKTVGRLSLGGSLTVAAATLCFSQTHSATKVLYHASAFT